MRVGRGPRNDGSCRKQSLKEKMLLCSAGVEDGGRSDEPRNAHGL